MPFSPAARGASDGLARTTSPPSLPLSHPPSRLHSPPVIRESIRLPATADIAADEEAPASCISAYSSSNGREELKSPPPLAKVAARVVVKAVRNSLYPPKDNPFVNQVSDNYIYPTKETSFGCQISENYIYTAKDTVLLNYNSENNMYHQKCKPLLREDSQSIDLTFPSVRGEVAEVTLDDKNAKGYVLEEKPGHSFLKLVRAETLRLNGMVDLVDKELSEQHYHHIPEEMQEKLRMASGQARLLVKKKMQQFEGLCLKNINQEADDGYPTTDQDLAGFWDMVKLQIAQVDRQFSEIECFRKSAWSANDSNDQEVVTSHCEDPPSATVAAAAAVNHPSSFKPQQQSQLSAGKVKAGIGSRRNSWSEADWRLSSSKGESPHPTNIRPERLQSGKPTTTALNEQRRPNISGKEFERDNPRSPSRATENRRGFMRFK